MKGMSNEAIAEVFNIQPATIKRWLALAANQCDKVNATFMKNLNNGSWMWVAFAPETRLIVAFTIGPRKPKIVPSDDLKYAQVVKKRKGGKLQKVEKKVICGKDIEQSAISTSLIERQNLTFRQDTTEFQEKQ